MLPPFQFQGEDWVDSVYRSLTMRERIGQLFMVAAYSNKGEKHREKIERLVREEGIGGLIFFQGGPKRQARLTDHYQNISKVPLLIGMDAEWGLNMRLDSTMAFPYQMALGAVQNDTLIYRMGAEIGRQLDRLGVHVNFAPVVDVNSDPANPVINYRSFGENKWRVARKGRAYMKGLQDNGVLACAKHFPGHGDTDADSHKTLPVVDRTRKELDSVDLYPFQQLINSGVGSIMTGHLNVPALDGKKGRPASLSPNIVSGIMKNMMGFRGLSFTDALNMGGVTEGNEPGMVDLKALMAGNDVLLFPENVPKAVDMIERALEKGTIDSGRIERSCKRILRVKHWAGVHERDSISTQGLDNELHTPEAITLRRKLRERSLTVLNNKEGVLPLTGIDSLEVASVVIGDDLGIPFQHAMGRYDNVHRIAVPKAPSRERRARVMEKVKDRDLVIVSIHSAGNAGPPRYGIKGKGVELVDRLIAEKRVVLDLFGNPYGLGEFNNAKRAEAIVVSYANDSLSQEVSAQMIYGGIRATGRLPVTASPHFPEGAGMDTRSPIRLEYTLPQEVNINRKRLKRIDSIALDGIEQKAYPGCQILVARDGKVFYEKYFGHHTYEEKHKVRPEDIYDLASITKIVASTAALMKLEQEGRIALDDTLGEHLPELVDSTEFAGLHLRNILSHNAGLKPWIPFYKRTMNAGEPSYKVYSIDSSALYSIRVADNMYMNKHYRDSIYHWIVESELREEKDYRYSDLGFYLIKRLIEKKTGEPLESFTREEFYEPLGLRTIGFLPTKRFPRERIVPTEHDMSFRKQLVHGDVHDPGAAMLGGVSGNAGVFSNARDLGAMMQMFLNWGTYGGKKVLTRQTLEKFIKCQFCGREETDNRRGAGFDKPVRDGKGGPTCDCVSYESFGHSGFTGTLAWADPNADLVYVFLSNRVYPSAKNKKLIKMDIRTKIQSVIHSSIQDGGIQTLTRK